jgi:cytochrome c peroxidase
MKTIKNLLPVVSLLFIFSSCLKDSEKIELSAYTESQYQTLKKYLDLPNEVLDYHVTLPSHISSVGLSPVQVSSDKATLGRVLFYDKQLSKNGKVSCASCHKQSIAFSDDVAFSEGFDGQVTERNSIALGSVVNFSAYYSTENTSPFGSAVRFFWDERAGSVQEQSEMTLENKIEMGMEMYQLPSKIANSEYYPILFSAAYGDPAITEERILGALTDFIMGMGSYESKYDKEASRNLNNDFAEYAGFTASENRGKDLYLLNCQSCHGRRFGRPGKRVANNGLDMDYVDNGVGALENDPSKNGVFKVPTLRNIAVTGPYMHDGRFETLEEVIDHYSTGIKSHPNLDTDLKEYNGNGQYEAKKFNFSASDKKALVDFLHTLTDDKFITAEKFSDPFIN